MPLYNLKADSLFVHIINVSNNILRTIVDADINSPDVFAAYSQHDHDHSSDEQNNSHKRTVSGIQCMRIEQLLDDDGKSEDKSPYGA